ncbi:MAG: serine hydrolase domain-containing protein [Planctomycetota bacterium]|jgi:CubicO group peptidase (beta-lactamase class C family)
MNMMMIALFALANAQDARAANAGLTTRFHAFCEREFQRQQIPGLSVAVVTSGGEIWEESYGLADMENNVAATTQTVYRLASISRMITAVAVLQLVQHGSLDLNANIRDFVPEFKTDQSITIQHILPHLSGIRTLNSADELYNRREYARLIDTIDRFSGDPLVASPGRRFHNSALAYNLLGILIERVTGRSFESQLKTAVFDPAGMTSAGTDDARRIIPHRSAGYIRRKDGSLRNSIFVDLSLLRPAEGLAGSARDLARFGKALLNGTLLKPAYFNLMATEYKTVEGKPIHYGLGCFVRTWNGYKIVGHGGWQPKVSSFLLILPEKKIVVAALANLEQADVKTICEGVATIILESNIPGS